MQEYRIVFTVASNAFLALEACAKTSFTLIITKFSLPQMGAVDLQRVLRSIGLTIPIVLLLPRESFLNPLAKQSWNESCGVLPKPFEAHQLCDIIRRELRLSYVPTMSHALYVDAQNSAAGRVSGSTTSEEADDESVHPTYVVEKTDHDPEPWTSW